MAGGAAPDAVRGLRHGIERPAAVIIIAVLGYVALFPYPFVGGPALGGVPVLRLVPLMAGCALTAALLYDLARARKTTAAAGFLAVPVLALVFVQALGSMVSVSPVSSLGKAGFYALTGLPFFFAAKKLTGGYRDAVAWSALLFAFMAGALCTAEFFAGGTPLFHGSYTEFDPYYLYTHLKGRSFGTLGHPVFMGSLFVLALPCAYYLALTARTGRARALALVLAGVCATGLFFTFTRSAYLAALIGALVFFRRRLTFRSVLAAVVVLAVVAGIAAGSKRLSDIFSRRNPVKEYVQGYESAHRLRALGMVARMMGEAPVLGVGVGNYRTLYERFRQQAGDTRGTYATPDNMYLVTLAETGLAGLGLLLYILYAAVNAFRAESSGGGARAPAALMGLSVVCGFSVAMFFYDALYVEPVRVVFWSLLGLSASGIEKGGRA